MSLKVLLRLGLARYAEISELPLYEQKREGRYAILACRDYFAITEAGRAALEEESGEVV